MKTTLLAASFLATIPAANYLIGNVGTVCIPNGPCLIPVAPGLMAPSGVLMIGAVNLLVSFSLALWMAMRARAIAPAEVRGLGRYLARRLRAAPLTFFTARGLPDNEPVPPASHRAP